MDVFERADLFFMGFIYAATASQLLDYI